MPRVRVFDDLKQPPLSVIVLASVQTAPVCSARMCVDLETRHVRGFIRSPCFVAFWAILTTSPSFSKILVNVVTISVIGL